MDTNARANGERFARCGQQLQRDVERAAGRPPRTRYGHVPTIELVLGDAHQRKRGAAAGPCPLRVLAVHLDGPDADLPVQRQQPHARAGGHGPAPGGAGDNCSSAWQCEDAIDRQPKQVVDRSVREILHNLHQRLFQILHALARQGAHRDRRVPAHSAVRETLGDFGADERQPFVIHEIALGQDGDAASHTEQLDDGEVLLGLWHDPFVGRDDEQGDVNAGRASQHVLDERFVTGDVHDTRLDPAGQRQGGKAEIDRDATALFFFPTVGVHTGERFHQCGLSVVDVSRGADYETGGAHV